MKRLFALSALALGIALPALSLAQDEVPHMTTRLRAGDIFEVMAVSGGTQPEFGWVLTKDNELMEAGRERIFRTRLLEPGTYVLDANARIEDEDKRVILSVVVTPAEDIPPVPEPVRLDVVATDPPVIQDTLPVTPEAPVVSLTPSPFVTGGITLDIDSMTDSDGDGLQGNDNDAVDTLFSEEHNKLHLWYLFPEDAGALLLSGEADDGTPLVQRIQVGSGEGNGGTNIGGEIVTHEDQPGAIRFELPLDPTFSPETVVIEWDFGDGQRSLLDEPIHRYTYDGDYDVRVTVRELQTGRVLLEAQTMIRTIGTTGPLSSSSASSSSRPASSSSSSASSQSSSGGGIGSTLMLIIRILLIGGLAVAIGAVAVWAGRKFLKREGTLQKTLEEAEKKLLGKEAENDVPPPMELKRPAQPVQTESPQPAPAPLPTPEPNPQPPSSTPPAAPAPVAQEVAAPSWLQKGLSAAAETGQTPTTPPPPAIAPPPPPAPAATPPPIPPAQEPAPLSPAIPAVTELPVETSTQEIAEALPELELLPSWLQTDESPQVAQPTPEPPVTPLPVEPAPPTPEPEPQQAQQPASTTTMTESGPQSISPSTPIAESALPAEPPVTPLPVIDTPSAPAPTPVPEPAPVPAPLPPAPSPQLPAPIPSPIPNQIPSPDDAARLERERERKRKKRQRYRENVKKRKADDTQTPPPAEAPAPAAVTLPPSAKPAVTPKKPAPASVQKPNPAPPAPKPASDAKPKPVPQDILPASSDDSVKFIVRAESVEKDEKKKNAQKSS